MTLSARAHSLTCTECARDELGMVAPSMRYQIALESITSCASVAPTARKPHKVMQGERVGRACGKPDGERDRHDGLAQPCAVELTERPLRSREHRLSFCGKATVATSRMWGLGCHGTSDWGCFP